MYGILYKALRSISEKSLTDLRYLGCTKEDVKKARDGGVVVDSMYCHVPERDCDLLLEERKNYLKLYEWGDKILPYQFGKDRIRFDTNEEYLKYIEFIRKDLDYCNNCHVKCCSWCRYCKVVHSKLQCEEKLFDLVESKYSTWRQYFMKDVFIKKHEYAILRSYFEPLEYKLRGYLCPCQSIYEGIQYKRDNNSMVDSLLTYDKRVLLNHIRLIIELKEN